MGAGYCGHLGPQREMLLDMPSHPGVKRGTYSEEHLSQCLLRHGLGHGSVVCKTAAHAVHRHTETKAMKIYSKTVVTRLLSWLLAC